MNDLSIIIINAALYSLVFAYLIVKKKPLVWIFIAGIWMCSSIASIFYYTMWWSTFSSSYQGDIAVGALLYIFAGVIISCYPLRKLDNSNVVSIDGNENIIKVFSWMLIVATFPVFIGYLTYVLSHFGASSSSSLADNYQEKIVFFTGALGFLDNWSSYFRVFIPILILYFLQNEKYNKFLLIGLSCAFMYSILKNLAHGSRFVTVVDLTYFIAMYLIVKDALPSANRRLIRIIGISAGIFFALVFLSISVARYSDTGLIDDEMFLIQLLHYTGECFLNFSASMWNCNGFTEGDNCFFLLKHILGMSPDIYRHYESLNSMTGIRMDIFYSFIGDYFIEFGAFIGIIITCLLSFLFSKAFRITTNGSISVASLALSGLFIRIITSGFTYFPYMNNSLEMVFVPVSCLVLVLLSKSKSI